MISCTLICLPGADISVEEEGERVFDELKAVLYTTCDEIHVRLMKSEVHSWHVSGCA
jgi:hypothetical protein